MSRENSVGETTWEDELPLAVWVTALNNNGERRDGYGYGNTSDEAVQNAIDVIREKEDDDTYVMDNWEAA